MVGEEPRCGPLWPVWFGLAPAFPAAAVLTGLWLLAGAGLALSVVGLCLFRWLYHDRRRREALTRCGVRTTATLLGGHLRGAVSGPSGDLPALYRWELQLLPREGGGPVRATAFLDARRSYGEEMQIAYDPQTHEAVVLSLAG